MAAEAMISLGAATGISLKEAGSEVPAVSEMVADSVMVPPEAVTNTKAITNESRLAILKEKLSTIKAQIQNDASNKPNGATGSSAPSVQQAKNDVHWAKGEVMCFMLPKPNFVPEKLINVYGILAKDVFADGRFGTCVMQDGYFVTFSYSVVWAAKERMGDEKYRSRCPFARLKNWFAAKTADATQFERDILASEQRYLETIVGHTSPTSDRSTTPPHS
jgi:hypothetical protein